LKNLAGLLAVFVCLADPVRGGELDRYLPADTEIYVTVNVRQILDSDLFKNHLQDQARDALKNVDMLEDILKDLGFDPFRDLERVIVASPGGADADKGLIIAHGRFDLAKFKAKGEEAVENHPEAIKLHKVPDGLGGQLLVYEVTAFDADMPLFVALPSKDTLVASAGKDYVVDALKKTGGKNKTVLNNKEMQDLLEKMDSRQSLGMAALGSALVNGNLPEEAAKSLKKVEAIGAGITIGDDIKVEGVLSTKSPEDARAIKDTVDQGLKQALTVMALLATAQKEFNPALEIVKSIKVTTRGNLVAIKGQINGDVIEDSFKK
jgi:hypothetical protein